MVQASFGGNMYQVGSSGGGERRFYLEGILEVELIGKEIQKEQLGRLE